MSTDGLTTAARGIRSALAIVGLLSFVVGIAMLFWPVTSAKVIVAIAAVWMIIAGVVYLGIAFSAADRGGWARFGIGLLGVFYIVAGIVFLMNLPETTLFAAIWVGIFIGIVWIWEGITAFVSVAQGTSSGWNILYGVLSVIAGLVLVFSPFYVTVLWWLLAISLIVLGLVQFVRSFSVGK